MKSLFFGVQVLSLFLLIGCAGMQSTAEQTQSLETRVSAYVKALNENDLQTLYAMSSPQFRDQVSLQEYMTGRNIALANTRVQEIVPDPDGKTAEVILVSSMQAMGFTFENFTRREKWIFVDGNWYVDHKINRAQDLFG